VSASREPEPELAFLDDLDRESTLDASELDELFAGVRGQVDKSGARRLSSLAEQPTNRRRLFALICFSLIVLGLGALLPRPDLAAFPGLALALILGSFGTLLVAAVVVAFRPIYVPALSPVWKVGLCVAAIAAAFAVALVPELHDHVAARPPDEMGVLGHMVPCLSYGLVAGLPAYALLRLLDRGAPFGRVLAGAAAGLGANMVLELHCPVGGTQHLMMGHAMVVVLFIVGVVLVERLIVGVRDRRR